MSKTFFPHPRSLSRREREDRLTSPSGRRAGDEGRDLVTRIYETACSPGPAVKSERDMRPFMMGLLAVLLTAAGVALAGDKQPARVALPVIKIEKGEKCVEPTAEMRRNHMNLISHQRDRTVHDGIRTVKHSLKNCVDCHASPKTNSVLGKDGFCESCHAYAAVRMDCFECHSSAPRKAASAPLAERRAP